MHRFYSNKNWEPPFWDTEFYKEKNKTYTVPLNFKIPGASLIFSDMIFSWKKKAGHFPGVWPKKPPGELELALDDPQCLDLPRWKVEPKVDWKADGWHMDDIWMIYAWYMDDIPTFKGEKMTNPHSFNVMHPKRSLRVKENLQHASITVAAPSMTIANNRRWKHLWEPHFAWVVRANAHIIGIFMQSLSVLVYLKAEPCTTAAYLHNRLHLWNPFRNLYKQILSPPCQSLLIPRKLPNHTTPTINTIPLLMDGEKIHESQTNLLTLISFWDPDII